jgi:hypothetical protein
MSAGRVLHLKHESALSRHHSETLAAYLRRHIRLQYAQSFDARSDGHES